MIKLLTFYFIKLNFSQPLIVFVKNCFVCFLTGEYRVSVRLNEEPIPESPWMVDVSPSIGDARKVTIASLQEKGLSVRIHLSFLLGNTQRINKTIITHLCFNFNTILFSTFRHLSFFYYQISIAHNEHTSRDPMGSRTALDAYTFICQGDED